MAGLLLFGGDLKDRPGCGRLLSQRRVHIGFGGTIDPTTQPVAFGVGDYAIRLPVGSFVQHSTGYVYQKRVNGIFLCVFIKFTDMTTGQLRLTRQSNRRYPDQHHQPGASDAHHR